MFKVGDLVWAKENQLRDIDWNEVGFITEIRIDGSDGVRVNNVYFDEGCGDTIIKLNDNKLIKILLGISLNSSGEDNV